MKLACRKYIMLFMHNNRYLSLTGLLTLLQWTIQPAPIVHRVIFEMFQKYFTKYFMKYFTPKNFMKFYITTGESVIRPISICIASGTIFLCLRPLTGVSEALCFRVVCPWVLPYVRACVRPGVSPARYLTKQWTKFHQTLVDDTVEGTDELIRRSMGQGQGHRKVRYLNELLLRTEAYTSTLCVEVSSSLSSIWLTMYSMSNHGPDYKKILRLSYDVIITYDNRKSNLR